MRWLLATPIVLSLVPSFALAQESMRYYTFQGPDAVVTCGQGQNASHAVRTIFMEGSNWIERDLSPTNAKWVSSGCAGYIVEQNRIISPEESRERLNAILNPPRPDSFETILGQINALVCTNNPNHRDCIKR